MPKALVELGRGSAKSAATRSAGVWCSQQCGDLIEFLAFSGCRLGEAGYVRWTDVDLEGGMMWVHGDPLTGTKNWERRQVPIIPAMRRLLEDLRNNPRAVRDVKRLNANFVLAVTECQKAIDAACAKLGIKRVVHHDLRHLFATACIESGIDIPTVAKWLGLPRRRLAHRVDDITDCVNYQLGLLNLDIV